MALQPSGSHARRTLIKDVTGTCRMTSYDLPSKETVYGKKATGSGEGTKECEHKILKAVHTPQKAQFCIALSTVISELSVHVPSKSAISDQDIVKCNKMAVQHKFEFFSTFTPFFQKTI